jgi:hypothetical protein
MPDDAIAGEQSVIQSPERDAAKVEIRTNTRLRQKYFVSEKEVVSSVRHKAFTGHKRYSRIIPSGATPAPTAKRVLIQCSKAPLPGDIQVEVLKDVQRITGIRITCPCGRHTELNFEYEPSAGA